MNQNKFGVWITGPGDKPGRWMSDSNNRVDEWSGERSIAAIYARSRQLTYPDRTYTVKAIHEKYETH